MEKTTLLHADYLDIIYDNRNKNYGGYELRRHYNERLGKAGLFTAISVGIMICFSFMTANHKVKPAIINRPLMPTIVEIKPQVKPPVAEIKEVKPPPAPAHVKTKVFTDPVISPDENVPDDKHMTQNKDLTNVQVGNTTQEGDSLDATIVPTKTKGTGTGLEIVAKSETPVRWVEQMPQFSGDMDAYISSHLKYPDAARESNIAGTVHIQFVVNEDGSVSNATIMRGIGGGCDQEAQRMVSGMPKWKPGKQNGRAVKVFFTLPIKYVLN